MKMSVDFLTSWDYYMLCGGYIFVAGAISILLYHEFRLLQIKDYRKKYDYVNAHEVTYFWYAITGLVLSGVFFSNTVMAQKVAEHGIVWFGVRLFISICFATIAYFILATSVKIYYPHTVERRLTKIRNKPRVSPQGNLMRKLSEDEEDAHLNESQIAEEASGVHSIDYDVWLDSKTGYTSIEKYYNYQHVEECPACGYFTMKIYLEEIENGVFAEDSKKLIKHYECSYCKQKKRSEVDLSPSNRLPNVLS
jgi:hypothetical protein